MEWLRRWLEGGRRLTCRGAWCPSHDTLEVGGAVSHPAQASRSRLWWARLKASGLKRKGLHAGRWKVWVPSGEGGGGR